MRGRLHRASRGRQAVERGANGGFELDDARFHAVGALGLGDAILVLLGGERAALDHALAEHLQRIHHGADLVLLVALIDLRFEVAAGQQLHRALQVADPPQDVAADIEPDEQDRTDQRHDAEGEHDHGPERDLLTRLPGRCVGFLLHGVDQLLHADAEADIELAGFLQNGLAEIVRVQFLLADLEDAHLAVGKRQQAQGCVLNGPHRRGLGQRFEIRPHARLRGAEVPGGGFEHFAAGGRKRGDHVERHEIAAGGDIGELVGGFVCPDGFGLREVGGRVDAVELGLRVDGCWAGRGHEAPLGLAHRVVELFVLGAQFEPLARGRAEALDHRIDVLHVLGECRDDRLVGTEFDDLAELLQRDRLGFLHFPGAIVQRLFAARSQQRRPLAGEAGALRG